MTPRMTASGLTASTPAVGVAGDPGPEARAGETSRDRDAVLRHASPSSVAAVGNVRMSCPQRRPSETAIATFASLHLRAICPRKQRIVRENDVGV